MNNICMFNARYARTCPPNCELRKLGCQDYCERFAAIKKQNEERKNKIIEAKNMERILNMKPKRDRKR